MIRRKFGLRRSAVAVVVVLLLTSLCMGCGGSGGDIGETGQSTEQPAQSETIRTGGDEIEAPDRGGTYDQAEDVALYLYCYGELPGNYITKQEAYDLGWQGGSVERYAPGKCIGGNHYGNYEGNLPEGDYTECDIDTLGKNSRGAKRLVFDDEDIYYTEDHYETFEQLYDKDGKL